MKVFIFCVSIFALATAKPNRKVRQNDDKNADVTIAIQCAEGTFITQGHLKLKCIAGVTEPYACIGSERIKNQEIPINSTQVIDGYWYKCRIVGNTIIYQEETRCNFNGKIYRPEDSIKDSNMILQCTPKGIILTGCYFNDSKGQEVKTKAGETILLDGVQQKCGGSTPGSGSDKQSGQNQNGSPACIYDGKTYKPGDEWKAKTGFMYTCTADAIMNVTGCILPEGGTIPVGQTKITEEYYYNCFKDDKGRYRFTADTCRLSIQCEGPNVGQPIDRGNAQAQQTGGESSRN